MPRFPARGMHRPPATSADFAPRADRVVLAMGKLPNDCLYFELRDRVPELQRFGDCVAPWTSCVKSPA